MSAGAIFRGGLLALKWMSGLWQSLPATLGHCERAALIIALAFNEPGNQLDFVVPNNKFDVECSDQALGAKA